MRTLLLCAAVAFLGLGITEQAQAQRGSGRGGYSGGRGYYGGGRGLYGGYGYGYGNGYGNYSYGYPFNGYDNSYYGNDLRNSFYPPSYDNSGDFTPPSYQQNQPKGQTVIRVIVPNPDALVLFDGQKTSSLGRERTFFPPQLEAGYSYSYHVSASWMKDGRAVTEARTVWVVPGQPSLVDFTRSAPAERVAPPAKTKTPQS
jgi:uncharacterized protein (TIGR03000 family)